MQQNYYISILESIYKEYGLEIFLQRLAKILNIHLEIKDSKVPVTFSQDRILINTENPIAIDFIDESYYVTKYFSDYKLPLILAPGNIISIFHRNISSDSLSSRILLDCPENRHHSILV